MTDEQRREYNRAYYLAHRERRRAYCRDWWRANRPTAEEKLLLCEANRERRKIYNLRARAKLKAKKAAA